MLDLSRIDAGLPLNVQDTDIATIVDAEADRAAMLGQQLTVTRTGLTALTMQADPTRVAQILSNLLDNARRDTPRGGRITIDLNYDKLRPARITFAAPCGPCSRVSPGWCSFRAKRGEWKPRARYSGPRSGSRYGRLLAG